MLRHRKRLWLLVLLPLLALGSAVAWSLRPLNEPPVFVTDTHPRLTLHRPEELPAEQTEPLVRALRQRLAQHETYGYLHGGEQAEIWVLPDEAPWPEGLAQPPVEQPIVAAGPFTLVARAAGLAQPEQSGLIDAMAVAVTQPAGSPAYRHRWLYLGLAEVWQQEPGRFPAGYYKSSTGEALDAVELLKRLESPDEPALYRQAAAALTALLMDRWGVAWPHHNRVDAARLTPALALTWTTGAPDQAAALERWQERMGTAEPRDPRRPWLMTMAELSPVRPQPQLERLPTGPGPRTNASPHRYTISAEYQPASGTVTGRQTVDWQNGEGIALDTLYFNLWANAEQFAVYGGSITVEQVTVDGTPVAYSAHGLDLTVPLGRAVKPGQQAEVVIGFTTRLPGMITFRLFGQNGPDRFNLVHWYPQLAVLDDRGWNLLPFPGYPGEPYHEVADYQVSLRVPAGTQVGATGHLVRRTEQGDRWLYEYEAPKVRDWAATGGRNLAEKVALAENVQIQLLHSDPTFVDAVARETAQALPIFNQRFGRYPYPSLVVSCCSGVEYPALFFTQPVIPGSESWRVTVYHELAHQWFYGLVGNDQYAEPWLDEAFARYADRIASRELGAPVAPSVAAPFALPPGLHISSSSREYAKVPTVYGPGVYNKGAAALEALEKEMGEAAFATLMREWVDRYRYQIATTADFIALAEEVSGRQLEPFFAAHQIYASDRVPYKPLVPWPNP